MNYVSYLRDELRMATAATFFFLIAAIAFFLIAHNAYVHTYACPFNNIRHTMLTPVVFSLFGLVSVGVFLLCAVNVLRENNRITERLFSNHRFLYA